MTFLVRTVQVAVDLPLVVDTTNPVAMAAGLEACGRRAVINSVSLEPAKLKRMLPLARQYDADILGYLLHPNLTARFRGVSRAWSVNMSP